MKTRLLFLFLFFYGTQLFGQNCNSKTDPVQPNATSIGIVIYSNDTETVWNALRLANYSKNQGDTVCVFLLSKGVEVDKLVEINKDIKEQVDLLLNNGGTIMGCGTCLHSRKNDKPQICKFSSTEDLYDLIRKSKKILTF